MTWYSRNEAIQITATVGHDRFVGKNRSDHYWNFVVTIPYLIDSIKEADFVEVWSLRDQLDVYWNNMSGEERIYARRHAVLKLEEAAYGSI